MVERHQVELFYNFLTEYQTKILNNKLLHDDLHTCNLLVDVSNRRVTIIDFSRSKTNHHLNDGFQLDINEVLKYFKNECDSIIVQQEISKLQAKQGPLFNNRLKQSISILDQALKESRTCPVTTNQPLFTPRYHFRARLSENTSVAPSFSQKARLV